MAAGVHKELQDPIQDYWSQDVTVGAKMWLQEQDLATGVKIWLQEELLKSSFSRFCRILVFSDS